MAATAILFLLCAALFWYAKKKENNLVDATEQIEIMTELLRVQVEQTNPQPPASHGPTPFDMAVEDVVRFCRRNPDPLQRKRYFLERFEKFRSSRKPQAPSPL